MSEALEGMDNVLRKLDDLHGRMFNKIDKAVHHAGFTCQKVAKINCPVGTPESTGIKGYHGGRLRQSIVIHNYILESIVGTNVYYAIFVHEGTVKMRGRPFLRKGFDEGMKQLQADLKAVME